MHEAAASCKDITRAPVTNWEPCGVTLSGYYTMRYGMKFQLVTPCDVAHLQCYEVTLRGNVTSVCSARNSVSCHSQCYKVTLCGNVTRMYLPLGVLVLSQTVFSLPQRTILLGCGFSESVCVKSNILKP